jgi:hypothetical protein
MCGKLDPLPPSRIVSGVRKEISRIIEEFASDGELPHNFDQIVFQVNTDNFGVSQTINESKNIVDNIKKKVTIVTDNDDDDDDKSNITKNTSNSKQSKNTVNSANTDSNKKDDYIEKQKKVIITIS